MNEDERYQEYAEMMREIEEKQQLEFNTIKSEVIELMGGPWWEELELILSDGNDDWSPWDEFHSPTIVDEKKGDKQDTHYDIITEEWVNQTTNGGYTGDEFAGTVYFKLNNDKYLQISYNM